MTIGGTARIWHNCKYHRVAVNAETLPIIKRLTKIDGAYFNPKPDEWLILANFREATA
jgi:hypothetical protein